MANIAPNMMSVGMSCEPPTPPPGEGAIAQATSGKNRFIGQSAYPIARQNIAREKRAPEGVERSWGDCLAQWWRKTNKHQLYRQASAVTRPDRAGAGLE